MKALLFLCCLLSSDVSNAKIVAGGNTPVDQLTYGVDLFIGDSPLRVLQHGTCWLIFSIAFQPFYNSPSCPYGVQLICPYDVIAAFHSMTAEGDQSHRINPYALSGIACPSASSLHNYFIMQIRARVGDNVTDVAIKSLATKDIYEVGASAELSP